MFAGAKTIDVWSLREQKITVRVGTGSAKVHALDTAPWGIVAACADGRVRAWKLAKAGTAMGDRTGEGGA